MTTAARPTFEPARGGRGKGEGDLSALSKQYSSRDLPGHTKIKYRSSCCSLQNLFGNQSIIRTEFEREQKAEEERIRMENILSGNPLLNLAGQQQQQQQQQKTQSQNAFSVKRRWDDDVVFKNCAKGVDESRKEKRFINDTLRSEFHKKFMEKYVK
ncbi:protein CWC15 homolog [Sinocyclocheilus anshuiensis]|uniref:protein CWC15 homolog n=1 Tax=Sinocyclocheilus anshuiensis TaxID=1608454 RepID=UPI0007BABEC7|nr:PREDICTED: protein CWC15 homolog [Sinocyclocheilus anshuiensis]